MTSEEFHKEWKKAAAYYSTLSSPSAPSEQDMEIVETYLKKLLEGNPSPKALILGCTIKYRKLLSKYNIPGVLVDINREMYEATTASLKDVKRNEKFVLDNWISISLNQKFDFIIGDGVFNNIDLEGRQKFLKNINNHLSDDGFFVTRIVVQAKHQPSNKELFEYYKDKEVSIKTLTELRADILLYPGIDRASGIADCTKAFSFIKENIDKYLYIKRWIDKYPDIFKVHRKLIILKEKEQDEEIKKFFSVIEKKRANDYKVGDDCPTYIMVKK